MGNLFRKTKLSDDMSLKTKLLQMQYGNLVGKTFNVSSNPDINSVHYKDLPNTFQVYLAGSMHDKGLILGGEPTLIVDPETRKITSVAYETATYTPISHIDANFYGDEPPYPLLTSCVSSAPLLTPPSKWTIEWVDIRKVPITFDAPAGFQWDRHFSNYDFKAEFSDDGTLHIELIVEEKVVANVTASFEVR